MERRSSSRRWRCWQGGFTGRRRTSWQCRGRGGSATSSWPGKGASNVPRASYFARIAATSREGTPVLRPPRRLFRAEPAPPEGGLIEDVRPAPAPAVSPPEPPSVPRRPEAAPVPGAVIGRPPVSPVELTPLPIEKSSAPPKAMTPAQAAPSSLPTAVGQEETPPQGDPVIRPPARVPDESGQVLPDDTGEAPPVPPDPNPPPAAPAQPIRPSLAPLAPSPTVVVHVPAEPTTSLHDAGPQVTRAPARSTEPTAEPGCAAPVPEPLPRVELRPLGGPVPERAGAEEVAPGTSVTIGSIEVTVVPPAVEASRPPVTAPVLAPSPAPRPAGPLARGFASTFGLRQG